jgi:zinc transporter ZupT
VLEAFLWGTFAASSLVIGGALALWRPVPRRVLGVVLAFGAGVLISAVAYELALEGFTTAGWTGAPALGFFAGVAIFFVGDSIIDRLGGAGRKSMDPAARAGRRDRGRRRPGVRRRGLPRRPRARDDLRQHRVPHRRDGGRPGGHRERPPERGPVLGVLRWAGCLDESPAECRRLPYEPFAVKSSYVLQPMSARGIAFRFRQSIPV